MHPIKDYFLIGDLHTAALVSTKGSIDWLCLPHFDSTSLFSAILDKTKGGTFRVEADGWKTESRYVGETAIVEHAFEKRGKAFMLQDFMVPQPTQEVTPHFLVRKFRGLKGSVTIRLFLDPRPNYAKQCVKFREEKGVLSVPLGYRTLFVHLPLGTTIERKEDGSGVSLLFPLKAGEMKKIVLEHSIESRSRFRQRNFEKETKDFWRHWVKKGSFFPRFRSQLVRSAITLKLMQFYPTGALIASPTTSLPEEIGGVRNWDYRYVWIRDATFVLYAFYILGFKEEAKKFFHFIETIVEETEHILLMYTIWGQQPQHEEILSHLSGYKRSKPVRIGNEAALQFQLDAYGSLIDAYYFMTRLGLTISMKGRRIVRDLVRKIELRWHEEDNGIWEVRDEMRQFTYGKVMAWVGVDRALRLKKELKLSGRREKNWRCLRDRIETWIWEHCYNERQGIMKQYPGTDEQDATNFLMVLIHFLNRHDERTKRIIRKTQRKLAFQKSFVYRYLNDDGLPGDEGTFVLCSFWMIAALAAVGNIREAESLLVKLQKCFAPSGLISEEIDPKTREYLGNFPQAFSHLGFIVAVHYIQKYTLKKGKKRRRF